MELPEGLTYSVAWDLPVPEGFGRSAKWRNLRAALNKMHKESIDHVSFVFSIEGLDKKQITKFADRIRGSVYAWQGGLPKSERYILNTKQEIVDNKIVIHVSEKRGVLKGRVAIE